MFQTVFGSAMLFFGLLLLIFNQRLAQASLDFRKWAFGVKPFIPGSERAGIILLGLFCVTYGLLYALHLIIT